MIIPIVRVVPKYVQMIERIMWKHLRDDYDYDYDYDWGDRSRLDRAEVYRYSRKKS